MPRITLLTIGRMKNGPHLDLIRDYQKRMQWDVIIKELDTKDAAQERQSLIQVLDPDIPLIALDERGRAVTSTDFAGLIQKYFLQGQSHLQMVIGGADGLGDDIRGRADHILSFGAMTWPHMLARVMVVEQLYRAQQVLAGHPYHRA